VSPVTRGTHSFFFPRQILSQLAAYYMCVLMLLCNHYVYTIYVTSCYILLGEARSRAESFRMLTYADVSIRQHTSAYVSIRQHTSAYVCSCYILLGEARSRAESLRMLTCADVCWRMLTYADVCWRMLTYARRAFKSIRELFKSTVGQVSRPRRQRRVDPQRQ
jgi:hypothetical protein